MNYRDYKIFNRTAKIRVIRNDYGDDLGYELVLPEANTMEIAEKLASVKHPITHQEMGQWVGLGARDSLRIESGKAAYGADLNEDLTPIEASLEHLISKRRLLEGGF